MAINTYGTRTDGSWSESFLDAYNIIAKKYPGLDLTFTDNVPDNDQPQYLRTQATQGGRNLVYLDSVWYANVQAVAADYPNTWYAVPELTEKELAELPANVASYNHSYAETLYLCGVAAGMETKTGTVAAILGLAGLPDLNSAAYAFFQGAQSVKPDVKLVLGVVGDFLDVQKGYDQARAAIDAGADVVMHFADNAGKGVIKAGTERNVKLVGESKDQAYLAPNNMITSYQTPHEVFAEMALKDFVAGKMAHEVKMYTMKDQIPGIFGIYPLTNVSPETKAKVEEVKKQIMDGSLTITAVTETEKLDKLVADSK